MELRGTSPVRPVVAQRYAYNGKELVEGIGLYDYGARWYDPVVGRWTSVDPLAEASPYESPYVYVSDNPIFYLDPDGRYKYPANSGYEQKYTKLSSFLQGGIKDLLGQTEIRDALKNIGSFSDEQIDNLATFGEGLEITLNPLTSESDRAEGLEQNGFVAGSDVYIDSHLADQLENASSQEETQAALLGIVSTILHETTHVGLNSNSVPRNRSSRETQNGEFNRTFDSRTDVYTYYRNGVEIGTSNETGYAFERGIWDRNLGEQTRKQGAGGRTQQTQRAADVQARGDGHVLPKNQ
jgi:RHS repeat-associated protein